jgi:hypothetical protein
MRRKVLLFLEPAKTDEENWKLRCGIFTIRAMQSADHGKNLAG